jgi:hypothetical protein
MRGRASQKLKLITGFDAIQGQHARFRTLREAQVVGKERRGPAHKRRRQLDGIRGAECIASAETCGFFGDGWGKRLNSQAARRQQGGSVTCNEKVVVPAHWLSQDFDERDRRRYCLHLTGS